MPIYAFRCSTCNHEFDRLQRLSDPDPDTCPDCGAAGGVGRKLTAPSFRLAGSGWYETDFKKDGDRKRNLAEGGEGVGKPEGGSAASDAPAKTDGPAATAAPSAPAPAAAKPEARSAASKPDAG